MYFQYDKRLIFFGARKMLPRQGEIACDEAEGKGENAHARFPPSRNFFYFSSTSSPVPVR
jgi:hypothetical protein